MADEVFMKDFREFLIGAQCRAASKTGDWMGVVAGIYPAEPAGLYVILDDGRIITAMADMIVLDVPKGVLAAITGKEYK